MSLECLSLDERRRRSALMFVVPELDPLIGEYRRQYTQDGKSVPPHITLLNPFLAPSEVTPTVRQRIGHMVSSYPMFCFAATNVAVFPTGVIYLTLEPIAPFIDLIRLLSQEFPEVDPYWREFDEINPHITVADAALTDDPSVLQDIRTRLGASLPVTCSAREVVLLQRVRPSPAPWDVQGSFPLQQG